MARHLFSIWMSAFYADCEPDFTEGQGNSNPATPFVRNVFAYMLGI